MRTHRRGFTLLELIATLAVVAVISAIAVTTLAGPRDHATQEQARQRLSALELKVAAVLADTADGRWPQSTSLTGLTAGGATVVGANTAGRAPTSVSGQSRSSGDEVVLAQTVAGRQCLVLRYSHQGADGGYEYWGLGTGTSDAQCRASNAAIDEVHVTGTVDAPSEVTLSP